MEVNVMEFTNNKNRKKHYLSFQTRLGYINAQLDSHLANCIGLLLGYFPFNTAAGQRYLSIAADGEVMVSANWSISAVNFDGKDGNLLANDPMCHLINKTWDQDSCILTLLYEATYMRIGIIQTCIRVTLPGAKLGTGHPQVFAFTGYDPYPHQVYGTVSVKFRPSDLPVAA